MYMFSWVAREPIMMSDPCTVTGNQWNPEYCGPNNATGCAEGCALDGSSIADYGTKYGITTNGHELSLQFVTSYSTSGQKYTNVGSRNYLMDANDQGYQLFKLKNQEFTFDVDVSQLPCGLNGALYFTQMDADGGMARFPTNKAGAKYGTGYCDAQCPHDVKFIDGKGNCEGWKPSGGDPNSGTGKMGSCCVEMDIWEANKISSAYTAHPCTVDKATSCSDPVTCGDNPDHRYDGVCDKDGCDFNSYRLGDKGFYGAPGGIDTSQVFTVVTQFPVDANGNMDIKRVWVQNGKVIENPEVGQSWGGPFNSVNDAFCDAQKTWTGDTNSYSSKGKPVKIPQRNFPE